MQRILKHRFRKKTIALLLVLAVTCVSVVGDNFAPSTNAKTNEEVVQHYLSENNNIKPVSELNLAQTDTKLGKTGETLKEGYEKLMTAFEKDKHMDKAVNEFAALVSVHKEQAVKELETTKNDTAEYKEYRLSVLSQFEELEQDISELNEDNAEAVLNKIGEKVAPEKPYISLGDDLPFTNVATDEMRMETYAETEVEDYEVSNESYHESQLEFTNDVVINDEIRSEFAEFTSVLEVYEYIKNNYMPEFYYGSRKGSVGAFEEKAGNDYDLSSLLIAILRDRGIPSKYVQGQIQITAEQAVEWTGAENINAAVRMLSALGIPVTALTTEGDIVAVRLEHVWVEAYVPYTDYRGAGNEAGESLWIPLDVSFKELKTLKGVDLTSLKEYLENEENYITSDTKIYGVDIGETSSIIEGQNSAFVKYLLENGYEDSTKEEVFGGREIVGAYLGYLPLTLPYTVVEKTASFEDIPVELTDSLSFCLVGNSAFELDFDGSETINQTLYTPDLYGKRLVLAYMPATEADEEIIQEYGGIFKTPAYLLKLKPQLRVDGEVIAEGAVCNAGYMQKYTINIHSSSEYKNDSIIENAIVAGGIYCIALDYGKISGGELEKSADSIEALKEIISEENIYTDSAMGEILHGVAKGYFAQLDMYNEVIAGQNNVVATRDFSVGIVGFNVNVVYTFNRPTELNEGGIFLDIGHDAHSVVSNENNNKDEKAYMLQSGIYASAMEHGILEQITGVESVSTIKALQHAVENNIPIHAIAKENIASKIDTLDISQQIKQEIRSCVNSGKVVIIPEQETEINQWSGVGYMVLDPDTFACGYMISGGLAGGAMTAGQVIGEYVTYVVEGIIGVVLYEIGKAVVLSFLPFGWVSTAFMIFEITMLLAWLYSVVDLFYSFYETGDVYYLQEALIQIASAMTIASIMPAIKPKLEKLKTSVAETIKNLKKVPEYKESGCFIAGTLILTTTGLIPIEAVAAGDKVLSFDATTQVVSEQVVEETFIHQSNELVHIQVGDETISATTNHPFYMPQKGFVEAIDLRAGDILCTVNGEYVIVEQVQHEILETPIDVYNFRVATNHTYYVGNVAVGVHNANCAKQTPEKNIDDYLSGKKKFNDVIDDYAKVYAEMVNSNKKMWSWNEDIKGGNGVNDIQKGKIKQHAVNNGYIPNVKVTKVKGMKYGFADFEGAGLVKKTEYLPEHMWKMRDEVQFDWLNKKIGGEIEGYTWHHTEIPGKMQLVPYGIHNSVNHNGGRTKGMWADAPR